MYLAKRCPNMNHSRASAPIKHCPQCGEQVGRIFTQKCSEEKHSSRRKDRDQYCVDCGNSLHGPTNLR